MGEIKPQAIVVGIIGLCFTLFQVYVTFKLNRFLNLARNKTGRIQSREDWLSRKQ